MPIIRRIDRGSGAAAPFVTVFTSLSDSTITNLAYDPSGNVVRNHGFGSRTGVRPPRTLQRVTRLTVQVS